MTQTNPLLSDDLADAPSVDEAVAALTAEARPRRIGRRRAAAPVASATPDVAVPAAEPDGDTPDGADDFGPYVARLMAEARRAAAEYRTETERQAAERAAETIAQATAEAQAIRLKAAQDAEEVLAGARVQAQALGLRVQEMAAELQAGAATLASAPAAEAMPAPAEEPAEAQAGAETVTDPEAQSAS